MRASQNTRRPQSVNETCYLSSLQDQKIAIWLPHMSASALLLPPRCSHGDGLPAGFAASVWSRPPEEELTLFIGALSNKTQWQQGCRVKSFSSTEPSHDRPGHNGLSHPAAAALLQGRTRGPRTGRTHSGTHPEESSLSVLGCHRAGRSHHVFLAAARVQRRDGAFASIQASITVTFELQLLPLEPSVKTKLTLIRNEQHWFY